MPKPEVYEQFDRAFRNVSAFTVAIHGHPVGRIAIKHGDGRDTVFAQVWGLPMVKGQAGGGNYDRQTAAVENAFAKLAGAVAADKAENPERHRDLSAHCHALSWAKLAAGPDGERWTRRLEAAGYTVQHVFG